jgi:RimJ/RimL family protein N-acetyltransferase
MLLVPYIFNDLQADLIETAAWSGNKNALESFRSYGFRFDREEKKWNDKRAKELTMHYYTMTREQWRVATDQGEAGPDDDARG